MKGAFGERLEQELELRFRIIRMKRIPWASCGCWNQTRVVACPDFQVFRRMLETHKGHISYLSASECKPCPQPCQSPSGHLSVQPHTCSGTGSSSSLSPASIAEDVLFNSTNEDQVTVLAESIGVTSLVLISDDAQNILLISSPPFFFSLLPFSGSILPLSASSPPLLVCRTLVQ